MTLKKRELLVFPCDGSMRKNVDTHRLGIVAKFHFSYANLRELINFCSPKNHQKTYDLVVISGGIEVN